MAHYRAPTLQAYPRRRTGIVLSSDFSAIQVVGVLPVAVGAVNDPPQVVIPHHHVMNFRAFEVWNRYLQTQAGLSATVANLTVTISTDTTSGQIMLDGLNTDNVHLQVNSSAVEDTGAPKLGETIIGFGVLS